MTDPAKLGSKGEALVAFGAQQSWSLSIKPEQPAIQLNVPTPIQVSKPVQIAVAVPQAFTLPNSGLQLNLGQPTQVSVPQSLALPNKALQLNLGQPFQAALPQALTLPSNGLQLNLNQPAKSVSLDLKSNDPPEYKQIRIANGGLTQSDFKCLTDREHILIRSDFVAGSSQASQREFYIYDLFPEAGQQTRIKLAQITTPIAVEQLLLEVITNSADNVARSRAANVEPGVITVKMNKHTISVKNGGIPIPVEIHSQEGIHIPEMVFSRLRAGSNLGDTRTLAGSNGYGAKLTNIFSTDFEIIIYDSIRKLRYQQKWTGNMANTGKPLIEAYHGKESSVEVIYTLDFPRFGYTEYPQEFFTIVARHCADISFTAKVPIIFNYTADGHPPASIKMNYGNIREYAILFFGAKIAATSSFMHYEWPSGTGVINHRDGHQIADDPTITPTIEMIVVDTPDEPIVISFVNALLTRNNGVHATSGLKAVASGVIEAINVKAGVRKVKAPAKGKTKAKLVKSDSKIDDKPAPKITMNDVNNHISAIISVRVINPRFLSQTKDKLTGPTPKFHIDDEELRPIMKWQLVSRLYAALQAKNHKTIAALEGKMRRDTTIEKGFGANKAKFASEAHKCTLFLVEGKSAMGYIRNLVSELGGRDYYGALPLKGKIMNVMNATQMEIADNVELNDIKKALGLHDSYDYSLPENRASLHYGRLVFVTDSDDDGKHITGLGLNNFFVRYRGLLQAGYISYIRTPHIRVWKGREKYIFHTSSQYSQWKLRTPNHDNWECKYYKGLGTSTKIDVKEDAKNLWTVGIKYEGEASKQSMELAFHEDNADMRKEWILQYRQIFELTRITSQTVTEFINHDFIQYSIANLKRAIPNLIDGVKPSQRKLIYSSFKKWSLYGKAEYKEMKVAAFSNYAANETNYHHDAKSLSKACIRMAQTYVGSNNLSYFTEDGQYGTREGGGEDAASDRYIYTRPNWWLRYVYREDDLKMLKPLIIEGDECEPANMLPIVAMHVINGVKGVATGFSTYIPCHNPLDVINWEMCWLKGIKTPTMIPWYRGFTGKVRIIDTRKKVAVKTVEVAPPSPTIKLLITPSSDTKTDVKSDTKSDVKSDVKGMPALSLNIVSPPQPKQPKIMLDGEELGEDPSGRYSVVTNGLFHRIDADTIAVTELPVGRTMDEYKSWLLSMKQDGNITDFNDEMLDDKPNFVITGMNPVNSRLLKLQTSTGLGNMWLLDSNDQPHRYDSVDLVMEAFCIERLKFYEERRQYLIVAITNKITKLTDKMLYIQLIMEEKVIFKGRVKSELIKELKDKYNLPATVIAATNTGNFTEEELKKLAGDIRQLQDDKKCLEETTAKQIWLRELIEFREVYVKYYRETTPSPTISLNLSGNNHFMPQVGGITLNIAQPTPKLQLNLPLQPLMLNLKL